MLTKEITVSQSTYALKINKVTVRARAQPEDKATPAEIRSLRECNGAVQWLAKESRQDLAVQVSLSQQALSDPRVRHCRQANAMVRRAKQHHELIWRFLPIPLENLRIVMHSDAAFTQRGASQAGYIISVTDDRLAKGELATWSPLIWRSHKMRRVVGSTLAAETQSLLSGLGHAEGIAAHFAEARFPNFDVAQRSIFLASLSDPMRRKQRQTSSQYSSPQSEPVVSSNAFMVQSGICLKRAEPFNTVCVMVVFPSLGNELQRRSFLESLDSEHSSSATCVKVKVPAMLIDAFSFEESAATLTLTWSKNTRKVQVQGPLTMLDRA